MKDIPFWVQMVGYTLPTLFVATLGGILALANMRRLGSAALMVLFGCGTLAALGVILLAVRIYLLEEVRSGNLPPDRYGMISGLVSMVGSIGNAIGLALLVVGAFAGRRTPQERQERPATGRRGDEEF